MKVSVSGKLSTRDLACLPIRLQRGQECGGTADGGDPDLDFIRTGTKGGYYEWRVDRCQPRAKLVSHGRCGHDYRRAERIGTFSVDHRQISGRETLLV